jgi:regulator of cell morphogenesis and NO signaling
MKNLLKNSTEIEQFQQHISTRLEQILGQRNTALDALLKKVNLAIENPESILPCDFIGFESQTLLNLLEYSHHFYLKKSLPEIELTLNRLTQLDFNKEYNVRHFFYLKAFEKYKAHLEAHINYEERYVFPYINCLIQGQKQVDQLSPHFYSLADFYINHTDTESDLDAIMELLESEANEHNEAIVNLALRKMKTLRVDLYLHGKIEEEVLIPRMIRIENEAS